MVSSCGAYETYLLAYRNSGNMPIPDRQMVALFPADTHNIDPRRPMEVASRTIFVRLTCPADSNAKLTPVRSLSCPQRSDNAR